MENPAIPRTFAFEGRVLVNPQVVLLNLTLDAGIPGDVMCSLIDGKHIVYVPHHDGLFVDRVDDCLDYDSPYYAVNCRSFAVTFTDRPYCYKNFAEFRASL